VKAEYTITVSNALVKGEYFTIKNVGSADIKYSYTASAQTTDQQATAIATAITRVKGALYDVVEVTNSIISLKAKTDGPKTTAPAVSSEVGVIGVATVSAADPAGANAINATYTLTINAALVEGESLTFENVAGASVEYAFDSTKTTVDLQLKAIAPLITNASGSLYKATVKSGAIALEAKKAGVLTPAPTVTVNR
jgi:hypothetical protein